MQEIVSFLKNILMLEDNGKVGLSQLEPLAPKAKRAVKEAASEVRLSDLMRGRV